MITTRRSFLSIAGLAAVAALTASRPAGAGPGSAALQRFTAALQPCIVARHGALTLVWLCAGEAGPSPSVSTLEEAQASGALLIT